MFWQNKSILTPYGLNVQYDDNEVATTQFIGLQIGCKLKWKIHIKYVNPKLSSAYYVMTTITLPMKIEI